MLTAAYSFYLQRCQLATTQALLSHSPCLYTLVTIIFTVFDESVTLWPESKGNREGFGYLGYKNFARLRCPHKMISLLLDLINTLLE